MDEKSRREKDIAKRAKKRLNAFTQLQRTVDFKIERLARMEEKAQSVGGQTLSDMPKAPGYTGDRMTDTVARIVDLENEIRRDRAQEAAEYETIKMIAAGMEKADERAVIELRYLDGAKWEEVSEVLYGNREDFDDKRDYFLRQTFKKHGAALLNFAESEENIEKGKAKGEKSGPKKGSESLRK